MCLWGIVRSICLCLWTIVTSTFLCVYWLMLDLLVCMYVSRLLLDLLMLCFTDSEPEPPEETPPACKTEHLVLYESCTSRSQPSNNSPSTHTATVVYVKHNGIALFFLIN